MKAMIISVIVGLAIILCACPIICNSSLPAIEKGTAVEAVIEFIGAVLEGLGDD
jgi:hypothetical protein